MRILVVTQFRRMVGGTETYIESVLPALQQRGHEIGICYQSEGPLDRRPLDLPEETLQWRRMDIGETDCIIQVTCWRPDIIFCHGISDLEFESRLLKLAPGIFYAHNYQCSCISGAKMRSFPTPAPCSRTFGPACLVQYFPRRCGGLNPLTMLKRYQDQSSRLRLLRTYAAVATNSEHLAEEYRRHGINARCVYLFASPQLETAPASCKDTTLLFLGRMDRSKGGMVLLRALPAIKSAIGHDLQVTFVGDGPDRRSWQEMAGRVEKANAGVHIEFKGWLGKSAVGAEYSRADLLVVPSLGPEPFGLVGIEAGLYGVPAVAFSVGGIPEWLHDGTNGCLAPGNPPKVAELAQAIIRALDPKIHHDLCAGARALAQRWTLERHCTELEAVLRNKLNP